MFKNCKKMRVRSGQRWCQKLKYDLCREKEKVKRGKRVGVFR